MSTEILLTIGTSLFAGLNVFLFLFLRATKRKYEAEADSKEIAAGRERLDLHQDQYDYVNAQLTKIQSEYYDLAERYRKTMTDHLLTIDAKCNEVAELKSKLTYFKGLRCYKSDCGMRVSQKIHDDEDTN